MRVGICDDDAIWCRKAEQIIYKYADQTETELEVICFMIPEELNSYEGYPLDMLFMDIVLENNEEKNGIDLVAMVNKKWKDCQIIYLTNYRRFLLLRQISSTLREAGEQQISLQCTEHIPYGINCLHLQKDCLN